MGPFHVRPRRARTAAGAVGSVLVLGGSSEIGTAIAARLAGPGRTTIVLAGRHPAALAAAAETVRAAGTVRGGSVRVETIPFDATRPEEHAGTLRVATALAGELDVVVLAFGLLGADPADDDTLGGDDAVDVAATNFVGAVSAGLAAAHVLRRQGHGTLVVLSSVAGERVRRANFVYGSSKAGVDGFAQGLGDALAGSGAGVLIVRPGFVHGRMTAGRPPAPLATTPAAVADAVVRALGSGAASSGRHTIWVPAVLRPVFVVFRHVPVRLWRRIDR